MIIDEDFRDTEDLDGFFSGWDPEKEQVRQHHVAVRGHGDARRGRRARDGGATRASRRPRRPGGELRHGEPPEEDATLEHPRCVFQLLKRHSARYTPELVGGRLRRAEGAFLEVAEALCENSGRERTSAFCYAVGWTQHTVGVQYIRTAAIVQLLLGNIGRPGGGSWRFAGTRRSRARPTSRPSTTSSGLHPDAARARARATSTSTSS